MTDPTIRQQTVIRGRSGPTGPIGVPLENPLSELEMNEDVALYVGMLEGQLAAYAINEVKYRTLLEMLTGKPWDATMVDVDSNVLVDIASQALIRRGMDGVEARTTVMRRFQRADNSPTQPPAMPVNIPTHVPLEERYREWQNRRRGRLPMSNAPGPEYVNPVGAQRFSAPEPEPVVPQEDSPEPEEKRTKS